MDESDSEDADDEGKDEDEDKDDNDDDDSENSGAKPGKVVKLYEPYFESESTAVDFEEEYLE